MAKKKKRAARFGLIVFVFLFLAAAYVANSYLQKVFAEGINLGKEGRHLYVKSDWNRADLVNYLYQEGILMDTASFIWTADRKSFFKPKAGKFILKNKMSNNELINILRSGMQPVKLTFNTIRNFEDLAGRVGEQIEADSLELIMAFKDQSVAQQFGFSTKTFFTMFLPNTYELYWNTSTEGFIKRMAREYKRFWTEERKAKAKELKLSQSEVAILASIVQAEQMSHPDERPKVAGLYINRLRKRMRLQSDPTLVFALGDFTIARVLNEHKQIQSPYNTYIHSGLPPGPINLPEISSLNAVLNYERHNYLYMCAKADFSGYHHFSSSLSQHNVFANQYRRELNRRRILQ